MGGRRVTVATLDRARRRRYDPPRPPDPTTKYALDVVAGRIVAGELVRKACERHLADLANGSERGLFFDVEAADRAIRFPELLRHYKGEWGPLPGVRAQGLPFSLEPWERFILGSLFGWKRADGTRRFRSLYLEVAKKNGKTLLAAVIAILLAFFDGEPGAEVYSIATKRDQAKLVWRDAGEMIAKNAVLASRLNVGALTISDQATASFFRPLGRDSGESEQGVNAHGFIVDELHVLEDRATIDNIETSTSARRQPVGVEITTAGRSRYSIWWEERSDAVAVVEGRATDDSMLVLVYTLDKDDDPFDEAVWPKANPNLGVSVKVDTLREQAAKAKRSPATLAGFLQLRMNLPGTNSSKAISIDEWDANGGPVELKPGMTVFGGLDLASVLDLTAFVLVGRDPAGLYHVDARFFCPEDGIAERSKRDGVPYDEWVRDGYLIATPGNVTDYDFVEAAMKELGDLYTIQEIGFDRWNGTQLATNMIADGATMVAVAQTHTGLGPAWRELEKLILEHRLRHGGNPILRWMAGNVEVELDPAGNAKPSKRASSERIDGMIALDMGIGRLMANLEDQPSVYEERGMRAV